VSSLAVGLHSCSHYNHFNTLLTNQYQIYFTHSLCFLYILVGLSRTHGQGSVVSIATGYGLDGPGIESQWGQNFPQLSRPAMAPTWPPVQGYSVFPGSKEWLRHDADPSPLLMPWSRKTRAIPPLPLWAVWPVQSLSVCTRVHFTLLFSHIHICQKPKLEITYRIYIRIILLEHTPIFFWWQDWNLPVLGVNKVLRLQVFSDVTLCHWASTFTIQRMVVSSKMLPKFQRKLLETSGPVMKCHIPKEIICMK